MLNKWQFLSLIFCWKSRDWRDGPGFKKLGLLQKTQVRFSAPRMATQKCLGLYFQAI